MTYKLSRYEMETSILWNEEEKNCTCFTCSPALQRRLDGLCAKSLLIHREEMGDGDPVHFPQEVGACRYALCAHRGRERKTRPAH